jgi:HlyD family secretion protein
MSARAEIETARNEGVLLAPIQAVVDRLPLEDEEGEETEDAPPEEHSAVDGEREAEESEEVEEVQVVFVVEDDVAHQRAVETGLSDATRVEIISGLAEGEEVVVGPYRSLKDLENEDRVRPRSQDDDEEEDEE